MKTYWAVAITLLVLGYSAMIIWLSPARLERKLRGAL